MIGIISVSLQPFQKLRSMLIKPLEEMQTVREEIEKQ
jgi:hypothetical protein